MQELLALPADRTAALARACPGLLTCSIDTLGAKFARLKDLLRVEHAEVGGGRAASKAQPAHASPVAPLRHARMAQPT